MFALEAATFCWLVLVVQLVGLFCAGLVRIFAPCRLSSSLQSLYCAWLTFVGGAAAVMLVLGSACWLGFATTFALMLLTAVCDFRPARQVTDAIT